MIRGQASYDPELRRPTPLAEKLKARIARDGPVSLDVFMSACLQDPEHGYYRTAPVIGRAGDFVTAPEISQVFGELIGLWCAVAWQQMGSPLAVNLIELGPGRGTLLQDALRAARIVPGFLDAVTLHLVETNSVLIESQHAALQAHAARTTWIPHAAEVPPGPTLVIANEFLDTLPITQYVRGEKGWRSRGVITDATGALQFAELDVTPIQALDHIVPGAPPGAVLEQRKSTDISFALSRLAGSGSLAALFIDYGHWGVQTGDTLQAIRAQHYEHPLTSPGEADLTSHVEFMHFANEARSTQLAIDGPVTQAELLGSLGLVERTSRLMSANPSRAAALETGAARLISPNGMGSRFKAVGIRTPNLPPLPGLTR